MSDRIHKALAELVACEDFDGPDWTHKEWSNFESRFHRAWAEARAALDEGAGSSPPFVHPSESNSAAVQRPAGEGQWISVTERLPKAEERVLFYDTNRGHPVRCYGYKAIDDDDSAQWMDVVNTDRDGEPSDTYEVTHWMALPEPPPDATGSSHNARSDDENLCCVTCGQLVANEGRAEPTENG